MKTLSLLIVAAFITTKVVSQIQYPKTKKIEHTDEYFGVKVDDPFSWLEDDNSKETAEWVKQENTVTESYMSKIPFREQVRSRLKQLWNFPKASSPFKAGKNYFMYTNNGLQNQFVMNILRGGPDAKPEVFIDPNTLAADGTVNMSTVGVSKDGKYFAYALSHAGSDWEEIYIKDVETGKQYSDKLQWIKFSGISFRGNGFYYSRYDKPDSTELLKGKNKFHKVYYHTVGSQQKEDKLIYEEKDFPQRNYQAGVTESEDYLVISGNEGTSGNNLIVQSTKSSDAPFIKLVDNFEKDYSVIDNDGSKFYVLTNSGASRYRLVLMDANDPKAEWKDIIPEGKDVLQEVVVANNIFIAKYMIDAKSILRMFSKDGKEIGQLPVESIATIDQLSADKHSSRMFYALTSFTLPSVIYQYDVVSKENKVYFKPKMDFDASAYETKEVFYESKDGTKIPMFIVHKKGLSMNGDNPVLMYGYGGFNLPQVPIFKIERLVFLENNGIFAMPCIRGGGEYGEDWHLAGTGLKKQNVFDDFIAAGEYLIREKYTNPSKLAINGRSNGGLLIGAVMTQRPDLFRVAVPTVGVMDMLKYHKFTIGWAWKSDYGSSEDEANFKNLLSYSPLHNIRENLKYPATLVITGDHDDRVVPAHSFKFIATLQQKYKGENPVLVRIDINSGHAGTTSLGSSKPVAKQIDEQTDIFSFIMYNLGMKVKS